MGGRGPVFGGSRVPQGGKTEVYTRQLVQTIGTDFLCMWRCTEIGCGVRRGAARFEQEVEDSAASGRPLAKLGFGY